MQEQELTHIVYSKEVVEFVTVSNEFCLLAEQVQDFDKADFINRSRKLLPLVYFKAAVLPNPDESTDEFYQKFVHEADWHYIEQRISQKLGISERFITITEPADKLEAEEVSLAECYADIYQDLKDFVTLYQIGNELSVNEALWELKENFEQVWGPRLLALLSELHNIAFSGDTLEDEQEDKDTHLSQNQKKQDDFEQINPQNLFSK